MNLQRALTLTFKLFLVRDFGYSQMEAGAEWNVIEKQLDMSDPSDITERQWLKYSRNGCKGILTRPQRQSMFLSIQNAINHAMFAVEVDNEE